MPGVNGSCFEAVLLVDRDSSGDSLLVAIVQQRGPIAPGGPGRAVYCARFWGPTGSLITMRTLGIVAALMLLVVGCERTPQSPVAIVDLDAVASALGRDDVIEQQINAANEKLSSQVLQIAKTLQEQLREQQASIGERPDAEKQSQLEARTAEANRQLQATQAEARQRAALFRNAVVARFRAEVQPVAMEIARQRGVSIVLTSAVPTVWFDSSIDITGEVIAAMRARGNAPPPVTPPPAATPESPSNPDMGEETPAGDG